MAGHFEPTPPDYRLTFHGEALLEMHAMAEAWAEFTEMLDQDPNYVHQVLDWFCAEDQVDHYIYEHAHDLARAARARRAASRHADAK